MNRWIFLFLGFTLFFSASCTADQLPEPAESVCDGLVPDYELDILPIIETSCAYSGCHLGGAPGVYNSYANLLADLESGRFRNRVIELRSDPILGMPPNYSPSGRPRTLTPEELFLVTCWLEAGYPN